jgi:DNA-binding IclR family transcriptional regulator
MSGSKSVSSGATSVPALRRAVAILDYLSHVPQPPNLAELTRAMGMPKSTAHGLVLAMEELRLVQRSADGLLRLGTHPLGWANGFLAQTDLVAIFRDHFVAQHDLSDYTVTMTVLDGNEVVYIGCAQTSQPLGVTFRIGMRLPAPFTATGKALLACLSPDEVTARFSEGLPQPLTRHSITSIEQLRAEIGLIRQRGFSVDDGQVREGMICLGAAIRDHAGRAIGGIAISLTRSEATEVTVQALGIQVQAAAEEITRKLGGQTPR